MSTKTPSPLRQLANLISQSVDQIDAIFAKEGLTYPKLDDLFDPNSPEEALSMNPDVAKSAMVVVAACGQLNAVINIPTMTLFDAIGGFHVSSCLRTVVATNVVEILRGHPEGLHVNEIAAKGGLEPTRLARILRLLASHHLFIETAPDVFKANRLSSMLDTMKSVEEIQANPENKYAGTSGIGAIIEHTGDEMFKASAYMTETLLDPKKGHSDAPEDTPLARAFNMNKSVWDWFEEPGNEFRLKRFASAAEGFYKMKPGAVLAGFKWSTLPPGSVVVDVGGGSGHNMLTIYKEHPELNFIIQDREAVIRQAQKFWESNAPNAIGDGTVTLQAHNFFDPQDIAPPAVFLCSMIMHDYGRALAEKILKHLRNAAGPDTRLLILDQIVPYASPHDTSRDITSEIRGAEQHPVPPPLLSNLGKASAMTYLGDLQMYVGLNGEGRTLGSYVELLKSAGWKIEQIYQITGAIQMQIVAAPV
ncbi:hypothetical protein VNI00_008531 [Paramarasmius palmivorus]|uniref:O-methyltransferase n=1 Tax=Paramarasmius palmivorus TaxID=297713 RepID=A0AAW0CZ50_9AGAR